MDSLQRATDAQVATPVSPAGGVKTELIHVQPLVYENGNNFSHFIVFK